MLRKRIISAGLVAIMGVSCKTDPAPVDPNFIRYTVVSTPLAAAI